MRVPALWTGVVPSSSKFSKTLDINALKIRALNGHDLEFYLPGRNTVQLCVQHADQFDALQASRHVMLRAGRQPEDTIILKQ